MYFSVNGAKYWALLTPSGTVWYRKEGSKTKYLGRRSIAEIKEMLAKAGAEVTYKIKAELEAAKQAVESQKPAQTSQLSQQSLTWKSGNHTYWLLLYSFKTIYVYMKGPSTKHKPRLVEKSDINGVIGRLAAAGALHVLEALRTLINGLNTAVSELLKPPAKTPAEAREASKTLSSKPQDSRKEAEKVLRELKNALHKDVERWRIELEREAEKRGYWEPDAEWLKEKLADFIDTYGYLLEKIQPYEDLLDKFIDAVLEATEGYLTRSDVLEIILK